MKGCDLLLNQFTNDSMLDMYIFESTQNIEQLELCILESEKLSCFTQNTINEVFRMMHTIKGSSAMMLFNNIATLAHKMEDLFYFLREKNPNNLDHSKLSNLILEGVDFIKIELHKIKEGEKADGDATQIINSINDFLILLKSINSIDEDIKVPVMEKEEHYYIPPERDETVQNINAFKATIHFEDGCEMENIRAYTITHNLKDITKKIYYLPSDIIDNDNSINIIRETGFKVYIKTDKSYKEIHDFFNQTIFLKDLELIQLENDEELQQFEKHYPIESNPVKIPDIQAPGNNDHMERELSVSFANQSIISVNVAKLDKLMDLVGEMVIAEAMVTQNPEIKGLELDSFYKASRQLHKITSELQDMVMAIRMVPLSNTFHKMQRIVRDMAKKLGKEVQLELIGEDTEVDKNIIEHISDPLMHLVRNSIDHGIESSFERVETGKSKIGTVTLEAKNAGSDVLVIVRDDGKGLNKEKILNRAKANNLLIKPERDMTDKEIYSLTLLPGFSTKDNVTEFSGRGVGMDVVIKNLEAVGGTISIDSKEGVGTTIILKIPLTLAIIDGMNIEVGKSSYTIPITTIKESFRPRQTDLIRDPDGNEMIMLRGKCYPILRLHAIYNVKTEITEFTKGIFIVVEQDEKTYCIFADKLVGQQQVVVKSLPNYIRSSGKIQGLAGCTLLGNGSISLILDIGGFVHMNK
jgi:two-component system chemotaxis sensor kinase CheA